MTLFGVSMGLTVLANIAYHLCQKSIRAGANPVVSLMATYVTALTLSVLAFPVLFPSEKLAAQVRELNWASFALGVAILGLEVGFLLAYRAGWALNRAALYSNVAVTLLLIPVGFLLFQDRLSRLNALGIAFAVLGLILMTKR